MTKHELILNYIEQFQKFGKDVITCFSCGMCYQFARILQDRFGDYDTIIMYDEVMNHFAANVNGRIYDITGDVTDDPKYNWKMWFYTSDAALRRRLMRDCIYKLPPDVMTCEICGHCFYDEILGACLCDLDNEVAPSHTPCNKIQKEEN